MAANAGAQLLDKTGTGPQEILQLVVCTESGVDHSKPVASFVQGLLKIGARCRVYEIKHACYLTALEGAVSHLRSNLGLHKERLLEVVDYLVYHMPITNIAMKAHRHLVDLEYKALEPQAREQLFAETFKAKVEPGLLSAREVGNIYTGSVYMGLASLLEAERQTAAGKQVVLFSYGSRCGAEFFIC